MAVINYTPDNTKIIHNTRVDFSLRKAVPSIHIVQYDTSLPIVKVDLYLGGQPYVIPANADLRVRVGKKDKTYVYKDVLGCTPDRKSVYFEIDDQMTIFYGDINPILDLIIKEGEITRKAGSSPIYITIDRNPVQNDYKQSTTENNTVDGAVEAAEKARDEAIAAKDAAVVARTGSENARNDSMAAKVAAEAARDISVTAKNDSVAAKNISETARNAAKDSETAAKTSETNAKNSENAAKSAQTSAELAKTQAEALRAGITQDKADSAASAAAALASQNAAKTSETNAKTSETNAKASETAAKTSETNSKASETAAKSAQTVAELAKSQAQTAKTQAETAKTGAELALAQLSDEVELAQTARTGAETARNEAKASQTASKTSETNAAASASTASAKANIASSSAATAITSQDSAASSAYTASTKASEASNSAAVALTSQNTASTKASEASASAAAALTSQIEAKKSETNASNSRNSAESSAYTATTKATEASNSAAAALASQNAAKTSETNAKASADEAKTTLANKADILGTFNLRRGNSEDSIIDTSTRMPGVDAYMRIVVALVDLTNDYPNIRSYNQGTLYLHRSNGLYQSSRIDIDAIKKYNNGNELLIDYTASRPGEYTISPCTFVYNGIRYGGISVSYHGAADETFQWVGVGSMVPFSVTWFNNYTQEVLDTEINNTIDFTKASMYGSLEYNGKLVKTGPITKSEIESVLTGNITTHGHTADEISGMGGIGKKSYTADNFDFDSVDIPIGIYAYSNEHSKNPPWGRYGTIIQTQYRVGNGTRYGVQIALSTDTDGDRMATRRSNGNVMESWVEILYSDKIADWAKAATKPTYNAAEVGARPAGNVPWGEIDGAPTFKTINGQQITGTGDISISGGEYELTKLKIEVALDGGPDGSIQLGSGAAASGTYATAIGGNTAASGPNSIALGRGANATGSGSTVLGWDASASGVGPTAIGLDAKATAHSSTALGRGANASGSGSTAIGLDASTGTSSNIMRLGGIDLATLQSRVQLTTTSDIRDKADIVEIPKALDFIKDLNPITYVSNDRENYISDEQKETSTYKDYLMVEDYDRVSHSQGNKKGSRRRVGLSAQEVKEKLIEHYGSDNYANVVNDNFVEFRERKLDIPEGLENKLTMSYETLVPFLIKAIQEQQEQIEELKKKINS